MLPHNLDLGQVAHERVMPGLTGKEAQVMSRALGASAPIRRKLFAKVAGKIHWYLLDAPPSLRGRNFGTADSEQEAETMIANLLGSNTNRRAFA